MFAEMHLNLPAYVDTRCRRHTEVRAKWHTLRMQQTPGVHWETLSLKGRDKVETGRDREDDISSIPYKAWHNSSFWENIEAQSGAIPCNVHPAFIFFLLAFIFIIWQLSSVRHWEKSSRGNYIKVPTQLHSHVPCVYQWMSTSQKGAKIPAIISLCFVSSIS